MSIGVYGIGPYGIGTYGGVADAFSFNMARVDAIKENVIRIQFTQPIYYSEILDRYDAWDPTHYTIVANTSTVDGQGNPARAVNIIAVTMPTVLSDVPVDPSVEGYCVDLILDRPMSSYPAQYALTASDLADVSRTQTTNLSVVVDGLYREVLPAVIEIAGELRDLAMPQTASALAEVSNEATLLGSFTYAADGDYAFDSGNTSLKKRAIRRCITKTNGFLHLPGYGLGLLEYGKKLARLDTIGTMTSRAKSQIEKEPDVLKAIVNADFQATSLLRLSIALKPRGSRSMKFTISLPL